MLGGLMRIARGAQTPLFREFKKLTNRRKSLFQVLMWRLLLNQRDFMRCLSFGKETKVQFVFRFANSLSPVPVGFALFW